jgi:opacity protein-like surface antigen
MRNFTKFTASACVSCLLGLAPASAETGYYFGGGLGYSAMSSEDRYGSESSVDTGVLGLTLGYRSEMQDFAVSYELDADISNAAFSGGLNNSECDGVVPTGGPYYCDHKSTIRLRALYSRNFASNLEWFAGVGAGLVNGSSAIDSYAKANTTNAGYTLAAGIQKGLDKGVLRFEVTYDHFNIIVSRPAQYSPTYLATTAKLSYVFGF